MVTSERLRDEKIGFEFGNLKMKRGDASVKSASEKVSDDWGWDTHFVFVLQCDHINIWSLTSWYCRPGPRTIVSFPRPGHKWRYQTIGKHEERRGCCEGENILLIHRRRNFHLIIRLWSWLSFIPDIFPGYIFKLAWASPILQCLSCKWVWEEDVWEWDDIWIIFSPFELFTHSLNWKLQTVWQGRFYFFRVKLYAIVHWSILQSFTHTVVVEECTESLKFNCSHKYL